MGEPNKKLRVALVHDHLATFGGAERVLYVLHRMFPKAPIYTLYSKRDIVDTYFTNATIKTSNLQKAPLFLRKRFKWISPFAIPAVENFNLKDYDIVISSSAFFAKGIITNSESVHISYCHTPTKYLWEFPPKSDSNTRGIFRNVADSLGSHILRLWDFGAAGRVDYFIANSKNTKKRIAKIYKKDAFVVYPPVDKYLIESGSRENSNKINHIVGQLPPKFFLIVSQLQNYKNIDTAIDAFQKLKYPLVIIGDGPEKKRLKKIAGPNIHILGRQSDDVVRWCYENCYAFIHPGKEDFGIAPVEAMLFGKPVLAYRGGGTLETVVEGVSGEFFNDAHPAVLADGVRRLVDNYDIYNTQMIKQIGGRFSKERFQEEFRRVLKKILEYELNGSDDAPNEELTNEIYTQNQKLEFPVKS